MKKMTEVTPGTWEFVRVGLQSTSALKYRCPCGCGTVGTLPLRGFSNITPAWTWNGDMMCPTLTPSIISKCGWHGDLCDGIFVRRPDARDCGFVIDRNTLRG